MQNCDNEDEAWDVINGECTIKSLWKLLIRLRPTQLSNLQLIIKCLCFEQPCELNHYFDFADCTCKCDVDQDCPAETFHSELKDMVWDHLTCGCVCVPEECDATHTWNVEDCECQCVIDDTPCPNANEYFDAAECGCVCEPTSCPLGKEFYTDICACACTM